MSDSAPDPVSVPIPVLCDRCRAEGVAGEPPFADLGDLLDFTPVPRRTKRVDGWDAERQRAYIVALAATGSPRRAAAAVGKASFGVDQLLAAEGSEGFRAASDRAMAIARDTGRRRLAESVGAVAGEAAAWAPPRPPWSHAASRNAPVHARGRAPGARASEAPPEEQQDDAHFALLGLLVKKYLIKLEQERAARLAGRIVEADFCLRQATFLEVSFDVVSGDGMKLLNETRRGGHHLIDIAETEMSKLLDAARRKHWAACGDPPRPDHPPPYLLVALGGFSIEPPESTMGGQALSHEEQRRQFEEQHARDAEEQIEWEAEARRDYEARSAASKTDGT